MRSEFIDGSALILFMGCAPAAIGHGCANARFCNPDDARAWSTLLQTEQSS